MKGSLLQGSLMGYRGGNAAQERYGNASGQYVGGYLLLEDVAEYQMPLLCEIEICLKKKCDKLADAFIDDLGLPRGLKFDPLDKEIIWHLLAKSGSPTSTVTEHVNIFVVDSSSAEPTTIVTSSIEVPNLPKNATSAPNNLHIGSTGKWGFARIANGFGLNLGQRTLRENDSAGSVASEKDVQAEARHMVSQNKRRCQEGGFDLDLIHINDIIAKGFSAGDMSSGIFRYFELRVNYSQVNMNHIHEWLVTPRLELVRISNNELISSQPFSLSTYISIGGLLSEALLQGKLHNNGDMVTNGKIIGHQESPIRWVDSLTALSIGGLLSEVSMQAKINKSGLKSSERDVTGHP
ncbi:phosphatidylinositol 3,4,5-trisphosphate 3-phosphatase and protein-tyrosine-phosphatase PTEN2A-like protein [Tanacetum coccineum]